MANPTLPPLEQARQHLGDASFLIQAELQCTSVIRRTFEHLIRAIDDVVRHVEDKHVGVQSSTVYNHAPSERVVPVPL